MDQLAGFRRVVTQVEEYGPPRRVRVSPLRTLRAINNLSASQLARLADVDRSTVRRLEDGIGCPQSRTAQKIAAVLGCPVELLFPHNDNAPAGNGRVVKTDVAASGHEL